jgi:hypothetical protein
MGKNFPRPDGSGVVQGDDKAMPNRGTGTGFTGDTYGADTSQDAINRQGGMGGHSKSHAPDARPGKHNQRGC